MRAGLFKAIVLGVLTLVFAGAVATAYGFDETCPPPMTPDAAPSHGPGFSAPQCADCHGGFADTGDQCYPCHKGVLPGHGQGPHGYFLSKGGYLGGPTDRCGLCHTLHDAPGALKMLPGDTVTETCLTCHDGTEGFGVYGALAARGVPVGSGHRLDSTNTVPGGDASTGGAATRTFGGVGGTLSCDDCHSPHNSKVVADFVGDRQRTTLAWEHTSSRHHVTASSKLLRQDPGSSDTTVGVYGSDWCRACHAGRASGGSVHNHPVDSLVSTSTPFTYNNVAILATDAPTTQTALAAMGGWNRPSYGWQDAFVYPENRGFIMPYPRTSQQGAHLPICQQCHEDSRNVGSLSSTGLADALPFTITSEDGKSVSDNPRFQNFPHETMNSRMLVETNDDLCLNCHPPAALP